MTKLRRRSEPRMARKTKPTRIRQKTAAAALGRSPGRACSPLFGAAKVVAKRRARSTLPLGGFGSKPMTIEIGHVEAIFRYPVKSMAGERMEVANLGWHGIDGDRRLALRRTQERNELSLADCHQAARAASVYSLPA